MTVSLPTKEKTVLLICEDIRRESGNKLTLLGLYGRRDIVVPKGTSKVLLPSLGLFFLFSDGFGTFAERFKVVDANGNVMIDQNIGQAEKLEGKDLNAVIVMKPFQTEAIGILKATLFLNDSPYEFPVEIKEGEIPS